MTFTPSQKAVIDATEPYLLVSACPGAGKSRVLVERIKRLIHDGTDPQRIVAMSFTVAASAVIQERLGDVKLGSNTTLHGFLLGLLTQHGHLIGLPASLAIVDEEEEKALLEDALDETAYRGSLKAVEAEVAKGPGPRLNQMTKEMIAAESFFQRLRADGILTFDCILYHGLRLLMKSPEVVNADYLMVDEIQDCTSQDWKIIEASGVPNIWCCGDFDQAIFGWRSGEKENGFETRCKMAMNEKADRCGGQ